MSAGDNEALADEQGGDRDFTDERRLPGKGQGLLHEPSIEIVVQGHSVVEVGRWHEASSIGRFHDASTFVGRTAAGGSSRDVG